MLFYLFPLSTDSLLTWSQGTAKEEGQHWWGRFLCGLAAGTIAKLGTHPLDVAKKRFQVSFVPCCWQC